MIYNHRNMNYDTFEENISNALESNDILSESKNSILMNLCLSLLNIDLNVEKLLPNTIIAKCFLRDQYNNYETSYPKGDDNITSLLKEWIKKKTQYIIIHNGTLHNTNISSPTKMVFSVFILLKIVVLLIFFIIYNVILKIINIFMKYLKKFIFKFNKFNNTSSFIIIYYLSIYIKNGKSDKNYSIIYLDFIGYIHVFHTKIEYFLNINI
ncbi:variable surface protein [Plasmodium gonderi]|uniref:Variable surface protein n=1 Tax=Plasmodium gonderi TaxID=77519 RepID=A0A1Y1JTH5_PLAGO|nr:variable surface protein [Plasmodium gonderi]GAW84062.1 variable surface protein [Plasmodium gonderi]